MSVNSVNLDVYSYVNLTYIISTQFTIILYTKCLTTILPWVFDISTIPVFVYTFSAHL